MAVWSDLFHEVGVTSRDLERPREVCDHCADNKSQASGRGCVGGGGDEQADSARSFKKLKPYQFKAAGVVVMSKLIQHAPFLKKKKLKPYQFKVGGGGDE